MEIGAQPASDAIYDHFAAVQSNLTRFTVITSAANNRRTDKTNRETPNPIIETRRVLSPRSGIYENAYRRIIRKISSPYYFSFVCFFVVDVGGFA